MFYTIKSIATVANDLHSSGKKIVLATGFFDLLHSEHINFLQKGREAGDILIIAVESDERARITKGVGRPTETQMIRCEKVSKYADFVIALPTDFDHFEAYDSLMVAVRPEIYAISSHTSHIKSKTFLVEKYGGKLVVVYNFNPEVSTTQIIQNTNI